MFLKIFTSTKVPPTLKSSSRNLLTMTRNMARNQILMLCLNAYLYKLIVNNIRLHEKKTQLKSLSYFDYRPTDVTHSHIMFILTYKHLSYFFSISRANNCIRMIETVTFDKNQDKIKIKVVH